VVWLTDVRRTAAEPSPAFDRQPHVIMGKAAARTRLLHQTLESSPT